MKVTLEFNLPEDHSEYQDAMDGTRSKIVLQEIAEQIFRPHRKHGYSDEEIQKAFEEGNCSKLIDLLETKFYELLEERGITLFE